MKNLYVLIICAIAAAILSGVPAVTADASNPAFPNPAPSYLVRINGLPYQEKAPDIRLAPASLTKMMTALIVLERCRPDEVVTVSRAAARESGSRIGLRRGQRFTVRDLLAATLIASANDASHALAEHVAGNQEAFVALMNARARALEMNNTRFTNACGHDHPRLYSTANDLAILAEKALRHPLFADLVSQRTMSIVTLGKHKRAYHLRNKNRLIGRYPGARGVKTGTTPGAGQCLVALAQRGDRRVLLVLMHSKNRWAAAPAMLDAAFGARSSAFETRSTAVREAAEKRR